MCTDLSKSFQVRWALSSIHRKHQVNPKECQFFDIFESRHFLILSIFQKIVLQRDLFLWSISFQLAHGNFIELNLRIVLNQSDHSIRSFHNQSQTILVFWDLAVIQKFLMLYKWITLHIILHQKILDYSKAMSCNNPIHPYLSKCLFLLDHQCTLRYFHN